MSSDEGEALASVLSNLTVQNESEEVRTKLKEIVEEPDYVCEPGENPKQRDRDILKKTMSKISFVTWPKETVLVLDIKFDDGCPIRIVVHNNHHADKHAEGVLKDYLDKIPKTRFGNCIFTVSMNWSPCGIEKYGCVDRLLEIFKMSTDEQPSVFFVGLYTKPNTETSYRQWKQLTQTATFRYMRGEQYKNLGIDVTSTAINENINGHNAYAIKKITDEQLESEIEAFCNNL